MGVTALGASDSESSIGLESSRYPHSLVVVANPTHHCIWVGGGRVKGHRWGCVVARAGGGNATHIGSGSGCTAHAVTHTRRLTSSNPLSAHEARRYREHLAWGSREHFAKAPRPLVKCPEYRADSESGPMPVEVVNTEISSCCTNS